MTIQDAHITVFNFYLFLPQICRIQDWCLFTAWSRQFNPEDSGLSGASGADFCWAADIEDLSHWWENKAG